MFTKLMRSLRLSTKSNQVLIAEIHNEFDSATDRILAEANSIIANADKNKTDKASRLNGLGFMQAKDVVETDEQIKAEENSQEIAKNILYYQQHYPNNKFITESEVEKICKKYGLVCGRVRYYKGGVPEKNLQEIERFTLRNEDMEAITSIDDLYARRMAQFAYLAGQLPRFNINTPTEVTTRYVRQELNICAPVKDFDTRYMNIRNGYRLMEIPDPIVLQPVKNGYLIVSKWGLEASDETLVNEKMN